MQPSLVPSLDRTRRHQRRQVAALPILLALLFVGFGAVFAESGEAQAFDPDTTEFRTLDGSENNPNEPSLGSAGEIYTRIAPANYADGIDELVDRPDERYLSNRIFNGNNQNVFSENSVTHWSFVWGQFIDHTVGLRASSEEVLRIAFDPSDPLEDFVNDLGGISTTRSAAAEGSGVDSAREQVNSISSYIDGWAVYGGDAERLDWLRLGVVDGDPTNNSADLLLVDGYLPTALARPGTDVPTMDMMGRLFANPMAAVIAGDVRANENIGLTAVQTLFAREHNRIVGLLPDELDEETKFQIARHIVAATQQYITYSEFLPAMGIDLPAYDGYDPNVDPTITNEFATVGYRAHSAIHGEFEAEIPGDQVTEDFIAGLEASGVSVEIGDEDIEVAVPLNVAFGNPSLLEDIGLGNLLVGLGSEAAYANDEQIDNQLRSVLFQIPKPDAEDPLACLDGALIDECFTAVNDLGALDVLRGYDHGMPRYNDLRVAFGLDPATTFTDITGEDTADFPADPEIDADNPIDDPSILDFVYLADIEGNELELGSDEADGGTVTAIRRTTTAARLQAVFDSVDAVDAFTGMVSEPHVPGTEFGELQLAMWETQFEALRDGDRFFYGNDSTLDDIAETYGIDFRSTLADVIAANTEMTADDLAANVFLVDVTAAEADGPAEEAVDGEVIGGTGGGDASAPLADSVPDPDAGIVDADADADADADQEPATERRDRTADRDRNREGRDTDANAKDGDRDRRRGDGRRTRGD